MKIKAENVIFPASAIPFFDQNRDKFRKLKNGEVIDFPDDLEPPPGVMVIEPTSKTIQSDGRSHRQRDTKPEKIEETQ